MRPGEHPADTTATLYANGLLGLLDLEAVVEARADHPALAWRRAGLMAVTGRAEGPALSCPAALASAADGALLALRALAPHCAKLPANGAQLLGERARLMGLSRQGRSSANGSCRLIDCADGRFALNLARVEDHDLLPILLDRVAVNGWQEIEDAAAHQSVAEIVSRGIELGLPIAQDVSLAAHTPAEFDAMHRTARPRNDRPLVLDFASLWAGPLAASLLGLMGADVVKIESAKRLDGARRGHPGFYALLNCGKRSVTIDFDDPRDRARLAALIEHADIVIEGSRPRALRHLGIDRNAAVARGCVWVSITAHRDTDRVGFGDDAAVAGGLATVMRRGWGEPLFVGDAIADPLAGLHAALAAWGLWRSGRAGLARLSLAGMVAYAIGAAGTADRQTLTDWQALAAADDGPHYPLRSPPGPAREPGSDNGLLS